MSGISASQPRGSASGLSAAPTALSATTLDAPPGWQLLLTPSGQQRLASVERELAEGVGEFALGARLRNEGASGDEAAALLGQATLRRKARAKFGDAAARMLFTQAGLEQASREQVAALHARRFADAGCALVADLGCGIGTESLALQSAGVGVLAVEIDPFTAALAEHNLTAAGSSVSTGSAESVGAADSVGSVGAAGSASSTGATVSAGSTGWAGSISPTSSTGGTSVIEPVETTDRTDPFSSSCAKSQNPTIAAARFTVLAADAAALPLDGVDGIFLDPARRTSGHRDTKRLTNPDDYSPSLNFAFDLARRYPTGIKLGPGFERELIPDEAEAQWVSVDGQLVEMGLWFGAAARPGVKRAALVLRGDSAHELTAPADAEDADVRALGEYLYEPDGSVLRARLIGMLAEQLGAGMVSQGIAYLTSDTLVPTPFAQAFRIVEELPASEKQLKRALAQRGIGSLEIKKRGADVDPAGLRTRLRLKGPNSATLILTRAEGRHVALLAERV